MEQDNKFEMVDEVFDNQMDADKEEDNIKTKLKLNGNRNKRNVWWIIIGLLVILGIGVFIYLYVDDESNNEQLDNNNDDVIVNKEDEELEEEVSNVGYVSCDDNTSLLNVRNSTSGSIIDGLSCYKNVIIEEELEGTDVCDNWYKISYMKNDDSYTGYACGTYIKKMEVSLGVYDNIRGLIDKANNYYENNVLKAYCGNVDDSDIRDISFGNDMNGEYVKSEYKNIDELKKYLLSFMDLGLLTNKIELSDFDNPKMYDNYYEIDGSLYCRNYSSKRWITLYTGNYDIEIVSVNDDKIDVNVAYEYLSEESDCDIKDLSNCSKADFIYDIRKISVSNGIITKMDFHK